MVTLHSAEFVSIKASFGYTILLMECLKGRNFVFVDVETTGASAVSGQIIEIGIIRVENGIVVRHFESLLCPTR